MGFVRFRFFLRGGNRLRTSPDEKSFLSAFPIGMQNYPTRLTTSCMSSYTPKVWISVGDFSQWYRICRRKLRNKILWRRRYTSNVRKMNEKPRHFLSESSDSLDRKCRGLFVDFTYLPKRQIEVEASADWFFFRSNCRFFEILWKKRESKFVFFLTFL